MKLTNAEYRFLSACADHLATTTMLIGDTYRNCPTIQWATTKEYSRWLKKERRLQRRWEQEAAEGRFDALDWRGQPLSLKSLEEWRRYLGEETESAYYQLFHDNSEIKWESYEKLLSEYRGWLNHLEMIDHEIEPKMVVYPMSRTILNLIAKGFLEKSQETYNDSIGYCSVTKYDVTRIGYAELERRWATKLKRDRALCP